MSLIPISSFDANDTPVPKHEDTSADSHELYFVTKVKAVAQYPLDQTPQTRTVPQRQQKGHSTSHVYIEAV